MAATSRSSFSRTFRLAITLAIALTLARLALGPVRLPVASDGATAIVTGVVIEHAAIAPGVAVTMESDDGPRFSAWLANGAPALGEQITVRGTIALFDEARNPGAPSERALEAERGVVAKLEHPSILARAPPDMRDRRIWMPLARAWCRARVAAVLPADEAAVLDGALWGERGALATDLHTAFSATGTAHVLVTAGLHLGIVAAAVLGLMRLLSVGRASGALTAVAAVWLACLFSDAHLPSVRAATMLTVALAARALGARSMSMRAVTLGALVVVLCDPSALGTPSFALSFGCVVSLAWFAQPTADALSARRVPARFAHPIAVSIAAQLGTWPLIAATFHIVSLIAPVANLAVVPLIALCITSGALLLTGDAFGACVRHLAPHAVAATPFACMIAISGAFAQHAVALILHACLASVIIIVRVCAACPLASLTLPAPPLWALVVYDALLCLAALLIGTHCAEAAMPVAHFLRRQQEHIGLRAAAHRLVDFALDKHRRVRSAVIIIALAVAIVFASALNVRHGLRITVLDVGQGDGIVIETPRGHTILVDTGGRLELDAAHALQSPAERAAEKILPPFLAYEGVKHIDLMLLTHPHGDHVGGAAPVLRGMPVAALLDGGQAYPGRAYRDALTEAARHHVPIVLARRGDDITTDDGVKLHVLAPELPFFASGRNDVNENSIVAMLSYGGFRMLLTGDAGARSEARLLAHGDDLHADILKVGHHGSAYSSTPEFIAAVHPRIAIISVGRHNLFHHPAPSTLDTLQAAGIRIYRTDRCGAVTVEDGAVWTMLSC